MPDVQPRRRTFHLCWAGQHPHIHVAVGKIDVEFGGMGRKVGPVWLPDGLHLWWGNRGVHCYWGGGHGPRVERDYA